MQINNDVSYHGDSPQVKDTDEHLGDIFDQGIDSSGLLTELLDMLLIFLIDEN